MDRIMSTSIILLDQNSNANDVDSVVFEPCVLFPSPQFFFGGGDRWHGAFVFHVSGHTISALIFH